MIKRPHIVILGAGYGGLCAAHRLQQMTRPEEAEITLINRDSYHVNSISLHEIAMGNSPSQDIMFALVPIVNEPHARVMKAEVTAIDRHRQVVQTSEGEVPFDILVIALGFVAETFGIPGMDKHAFQIETLAKSEAISRHLEDQFRHYAFTDPIDRDPKDVSIIVGGSGFTGIELLGEIVERLPHLCKKYSIAQDEVTVKCVSADKKMLPMFSESEVNFIQTQLEKHGIQFYFGACIKQATANSFIFDDENGVEQEFFAHTLIWTGGVSGNPLMKDTFGDAVKRGRLVVNQDLTIPGYDNIYVIGDCAAFIPPEKDCPEPTTAQIATQMGYHAAENIERQLKNRPRKPFQYIYRGTVCSLGAHQGLASVRNKTIVGFPAMRLKRLIESVTDYKISGLRNALKYSRIFRFFYL